jgi:hypothetical protein
LFSRNDNNKQNKTNNKGKKMKTIKLSKIATAILTTFSLQANAALYERIGDDTVKLDINKVACIQKITDVTCNVTRDDDYSIIRDEYSKGLYKCLGHVSYRTHSDQGQFLHTGKLYAEGISPVTPTLQDTVVGTLLIFTIPFVIRDYSKGLSDSKAKNEIKSDLQQVGLLPLCQGVTPENVKAEVHTVGTN